MEQKAMINQGLNERIFDTFVTQLGFNLHTSKKLGLLAIKIFDCLIITSHHTTEFSSNQIMLTKSGTSYKSKTGQSKTVCLLDYSHGAAQYKRKLK